MEYWARTLKKITGKLEGESDSVHPNADSHGIDFTGEGIAGGIRYNPGAKCLIDVISEEWFLNCLQCAGR